MSRPTGADEKTAGRVAWITIAPVKGLALVARDEIRLETFGVAEDRRYCLVDSQDRLINGKRAPALGTIAPVVDEAAGTLELRFRDGSKLAAPIDLAPGSVDVHLFGRIAPAREVRGPWAAALSGHAGFDVRLVRFERPGDGLDRPGGGASILSAAALEGLALAAGIEGQVDGRRFRMLFGVDGIAANAEDDWIDRPIRFGEAVVMPRGNVGRCAVTTRDPDTGVADLDTLRIIGDYRGGEPTTEPLPFGVWATVRIPGTVRVGDPVAPLENLPD